MVSTAKLLETDEFASPEYAPEVQALPYMQVLNDKDPNRSGFFLSAENAEAVNFQATQEWQPYEATFNSGDSTAGFRSLTARFLILRRSPLLMFSRGDLTFLGPYQRSQYNAEVVLKTRYLVYLVSKQKELLHDSPLQFTSKGAVCGSFGEHYGKFCREMNKAYSQQRGDRFFALSIFAVKLQPELKGSEKKSWVCAITEHAVPKVDKWKQLFVGYDQATKEKVLADFDTYPDFGKPEQEEKRGELALDPFGEEIF